MSSGGAGNDGCELARDGHMWQRRCLLVPVHGSRGLYGVSLFTEQACSSTNTSNDFNGEETTDCYSLTKEAAMRIEFAR
jgi:hypothetical protein